jgi:hypothetical protein
VHVYLTRIVFLLLITLMLGTGLSLATPENLSGTIDRVDLDRETFTLTTSTGTREFKASVDMLQDLEAGDVVDVVAEGNIAKDVTDQSDPEQQENKKGTTEDDDNSSDSGNGSR